MEPNDMGKELNSEGLSGKGVGVILQLEGRLEMPTNSSSTIPDRPVCRNTECRQTQANAQDLTKWNR
jgi:hypothetical protein